MEYVSMTHPYSGERRAWDRLSPRTKPSNAD
jgi:hypothetical protein